MTGAPWLLELRRFGRSPSSVVWGYALVGAAWILLSDHLLELLPVGSDPGPWQTAKGLGFVVVTALSLNLLIRRASGALHRAGRSLSEERRERRRAEADLEVSQRVLDVAGTAARLGSWIYDEADGGSLRCSEAVQDILGVDPRRFDGAPGSFLDLIHPDDRALVREASRQAFTDGTPMRFDVRLSDIRSPDARPSDARPSDARPSDARLRDDATQRWVHLEAAPLEGEVGRPRRLVGILQDITERRAADEALRHAHKVQALGQLTGSVAHDFNNVLTVVLGHIETLIEDERDPDRLSSAEMIRSAAERGAALTQQLLAFGRRQVLAPRPVDANTLVTGMEELLAWTVGRTVRLDLHLSQGLWTMTADPRQLETALVNLAVNARDAMPGGGTLRIETGNALFGEQPFVRLRVRDSGTGMTPDVLRHAIEPFFTTKPVGDGTGLGLSQVYGFVQQSGGHFRMDSTPGQGTTATLFFPRAGIG